MGDPPINRQEQTALLGWVRDTIETAVRGEPSESPAEADVTDALRSPHAVFVTLKRQGELRGCIGKMDFERPLWVNALDAAVSSALEDPRFPPVQPNELGELSLSISILNPPEDIATAESFDVNCHGIIVQKGWRHALLLPKVAQEQGWDARQTLETVCLKAGLPADAWQDPAARLQVFTAFEFDESALSSD